MIDTEPREGETLDLLAGEWRIFQLRRGHRFSTDDVVTAFHAAEDFGAARRILDLGCGIGSVGLTLLHRLGGLGNDDAELLGIEVQEVSVGLARRTVALNSLGSRVEIIHGDLRDESVLAYGHEFDLITGSPPYIPEGKGLVSPNPQRAGARIELRGSIYDYCAAARRYLAPGGRFCFVMAAADSRTEDAPQQHGFTVLSRRNYVFREGRDPHIATLFCGRTEDGPFLERSESTTLIRDKQGEWTDDYRRMRSLMGLPPNIGSKRRL